MGKRMFVCLAFFFSSNLTAIYLLSIYLSIDLSNFYFRHKPQKFNSIMSPRFRQKFHLSGKSTDVSFYKKSAVLAKFHLSGKDTEV